MCVWKQQPGSRGLAWLVLLLSLWPALVAGRPTAVILDRSEGNRAALEQQERWRVLDQSWLRGLSASEAGLSSH